MKNVPTIVAALALICTAMVNAHVHAAQAACPPPGWHAIVDGKLRAARESDLLAEAARRDVVLLGEHHDDADHHHWQLQTLAGLRLVRPNMVIGFESFPRRVQPVLDQWVAGDLTVQQFLERTEWRDVWGFPPELYLPLFQFARINRIPMIALNVERTLIQAVGEKGWESVPEDKREGVSRAARVSPEYETYLFDVYKEHAGRRKKTAPPARNDTAFSYFVESQSTWDRAMAEALASRVRTRSDARPLAVGIMGSGHVRYGHGVPHQLRDLGIVNVATFLPVGGTDCEELKGNLATAIFALPRAATDKPPPPRLGVRLDTNAGVVRIAEVTTGSLAEQTGIRAGDEVMTVAGIPVKNASGVVQAIARQPAGTWLPMQVRRGGSMVELVVKFPPK